MRKVGVVVVGLMLSVGWAARADEDTALPPVSGPDTALPETAAGGAPLPQAAAPAAPAPVAPIPADVAPADPSPPATPDAPAVPAETVPAAPPQSAPVDVTPAPANTRPPSINVNPPPPAIPPIRRPPDANAAATTGAVTAKIPVEPLPPLPPDAGRLHRPDFASLGWAVFAGGGYEDFTNSNVRGMTGGAGAWDARLIAGTRSILGLEAAYVGASRNIEALGLGTNSNLVSNGFEGAVRFNVPVTRAASLYEPFGYVGLGYSHYSVTNYTVAASADVASGDNVMTVPFGAGFAYGYKAFMADARVNYTPTFYNDMFQASTGGNGALNHWGVGGNLGLSF